MPGVCRCDLTNACALYHYHCIRGFGGHRAPGISCALFSEGAGPKSKPRAKKRAARSRSHAQCAPLPPRALARGGVRGEQSSLSRSGVGGLSACSSGSEFAEAPPTPDPSPPLCGGGGGGGGGFARGGGFKI